tara:strand:- start:779 stop:1786 length:1008 start_codon:yes stop_codon:yes gene_type:complete
MPKAWVQQHKLKKGDLIGIEEGTNELVFHADSKEIEKEEKTVSINIDNKKLNFIKAEIITAYLDNNHTIEIFSSTLEDDAPLIKGILRNLSGMEIIEQTSKRIVAKDLIDVSSISIQNIIRRMDIITRSMMEDNILCMQGKCNPKSIVHRDVDVNRLYYLGCRVIKNAMENPILMKKLKTTPWKLLVDKTILRRIEEIADSQKRVCKLIAHAEFMDKFLQEFKQLNEDIKERYCNVMKAYYTNDKKLAYDIEVTSKIINEKCDKFLEHAGKAACTNCQLKFSEQLINLSKKEKIDSKKLSMDTSKTIVSVANMAEYTKATGYFVKYIARTVLSMD